MKRSVCGLMLLVALCWSALAEEAGNKPAAAGAESQALLTSGRKLLGEGKLVEAVTLLEKARMLEPQNHEAGFLLSAAYVGQERFAEALPILEVLQKALPDNPMVQNNLAWVYVKIKDPAIRNPGKAVKLARAAVMEAPADYIIWNTLSEAYYAEGRYDRALKAAQSALRLSVLAGVTNTAVSRDLIARCRRAAGETGRDDTEKE